MKDSFFLILGRAGARRIIKGKHGRPLLAKDEYAVRLSVEIPDSTFAPRPTAEATIRIPESAVIAPSVEVEVLEPPVQADEVDA